MTYLQNYCVLVKNGCFKLADLLCIPHCIRLLKSRTKRICVCMNMYVCVVYVTCYICDPLHVHIHVFIFMYECVCVQRDYKELTHMTIEEKSHMCCLQTGGPES